MGKDTNSNKISMGGDSGLVPKFYSDVEFGGSIHIFYPKVLSKEQSGDFIRSHGT